VNHVGMNFCDGFTGDEDEGIDDKIPSR